MQNPTKQQESLASINAVDIAECLKQLNFNDKFLENHPGNCNVYLLKGTTFCRLVKLTNDNKYYEKAIENFSLAIKFAPKTIVSSYLMDRANAYFEINKIDLAKQDVNTAKANFHYMNNNFEKMYVEARLNTIRSKFIVLSMNNSDGILQAESILDSTLTDNISHYHNMLTYYNNNLEKKPDDAKTYHFKGKTFCHLAKLTNNKKYYVEAIAQFDLSIKFAPQNIVSSYLLDRAKIYLEINKIDLAKQDLVNAEANFQYVNDIFEKKYIKHNLQELSTLISDQSAINATNNLIEDDVANDNQHTNDNYNIMVVKQEIIAVLNCLKSGTNLSNRQFQVDNIARKINHLTADTDIIAVHNNVAQMISKHVTEGQLVDLEDQIDDLMIEHNPVTTVGANAEIYY